MKKQVVNLMLIIAFLSCYIVACSQHSNCDNNTSISYDITDININVVSDVELLRFIYPDFYNAVNTSNHSNIAEYLPDIIYSNIYVIGMCYNVDTNSMTYFTMDDIVLYYLANRLEYDYLLLQDSQEIIKQLRVNFNN